MFGVRAFLPPNLHQIVQAQDPGQTEYIWSPMSPSVCFKNALNHSIVVLIKRYPKVGWVFGVVMVTSQPHNFQVSRKLLIGSRISVLLQNIPPFSKGGQRWQHWAAKQLKCWVNKLFAKLQYSAPLPYLWIQMASVGRYLPEYTSYFAPITHTLGCEKIPCAVIYIVRAKSISMQCWKILLPVQQNAFKISWFPVGRLE